MEHALATAKKKAAGKKAAASRKAGIASRAAAEGAGRDRVIRWRPTGGKRNEYRLS
jgi:hypothetical protein